MQKMVKRGFRDERKRILTPSLSQGEGECSDEKSEGNAEEMCRKCGGDFNFTKILNFEKVCDAKAILRLSKHLRGNDTKKKG